MSTGRNIVIQGRVVGPTADTPIEMCEHKGVGHPDTLTDGACEAAACALANAYEHAFGRVLHFNVDKGLLIAGSSVPRFGGGQVTAAIKLIICGRATQCAEQFDVGAVVVAAVGDYLRRSIRADPAHFRIIPEIRAGSASLAGIYASARVVANDTSFGVGFAPFSRLEQEVLDAAGMLRSDGFRSRFPAAGDDFKIMGLRLHDQLRLTVALALVDRHVDSVAHYFETKQAICAHLTEAASPGTAIALNCLDRPDARDESGLHLTVTGLSAEMGDDGQVGRGNRVNGLITPNRSMSLEAAAGKNPVAHVGKIYNVLANAIARDIVGTVEGITDAQVQLLSTIGQPLDQPQMAFVALGTSAALSAAMRDEVDRVVNSWFDRIDVVTGDLAHGRIASF